MCAVGGEDLVVSEQAGPEQRVREAEALLQKGDALRELRRWEDALACYDALIERCAGLIDGELGERVLLARRGRAAVLGSLKRADDALAAAEDLLVDAQGATTPLLRWCWATGLVVRAEMLLRSGRTEAAQCTADELEQEFARDPWQGPKRFNVVAASMTVRAQALAREGKNAEALSVIETVVGRYGDEQGGAGRLLLARARFVQARLLRELGRADDADLIIDDLDERFGCSEDSRLRELAQSAVLSRAGALSRSRRYDEAVAALQGLVDNGVPARTEVSAKLGSIAMGLKAVALAKAGRVEEALNACDQLTERYGDDPDIELRRRVAASLQEVAGVIARGGNPQQALQLIAQTLDRAEHFALSPELVAQGLLLSARARHDLGQYQGELELCDEILTRFSHNPPAAAPWIVPEAMQQRAPALARLGRHRRAIAACDAVVTRYDSDREVRARVAVVRALSYKAQLLAGRGRTRQALASLDALLRRTEGSSTADLQPWITQANEQRTALKSRQNDRRRILVVALAPIGMAAIALLMWLRLTHAVVRRR